MPRVKITEAVFGRQATGVAVLLDGASVQVNTSAGPAATVYAASVGGTTVSNPLTSSNGVLPGYLDEGAYTLTVTFGGVTGSAVPFEARAAYPSGANDGDVLSWSSGTSAVAWANPGALAGSLPWKIDIDVLTAPATTTGFTVRTQNSGWLRGSTLNNNTGTQNDQVGWDVVLAAGTWTFSMIHNTGANRGIYTVSLDGVTVSGGTIDGYAASGVDNTYTALTGITVATSGKKRLLLKMATKNGSSSSYVGQIQLVGLTRTA